MSLINFDFTTGMPGGVTVTSSPAGYAKTSSGTLTSFSANAGRRTDLGLLIEAGSTNIALNSQDLTTGTTAIGCVVTANQSTAPDGTTTAEKLVENNGTNLQYLAPTTGLTITAGTWTSSLYVKNTGFNLFYIDCGDGGANGVFSGNLNLTTGAIGAAGSYGSGFTLISEAVESLGSGWYRLSLTYSVASTKTVYPVCIFPNSPNGNGTNGVFLWNWQTENNSSASSPISTAGSSVTRAADSVSFTIPSGVNQIVYTFDDNSKQTVSVSAGSYTIPTTLNRAQIKTIVSNEISATASQTTVGPSQSAAGTVKVSASASQTTAAASQTATAAVAVGAAASQTTAAASQSAAGTVKVSVAASQTTAAPAQAATATSTVSASASQTTAAPAQTATAAVKDNVAASQTTAAPAQTATVVNTVSAAASQSIAAPAQTSTAVNTVSASASQTTSAPSQTATAVLGTAFNFTGSQTTAAPTQVATAAAAVSASASQAVPAPSAAETATVALAASQSVTTATPSQTATVEHIRLVSASQATDAPSQVATGEVIPNRYFAADQATPAPSQVATVLVAQGVLAVANQVTVPPETAGLINVFNQAAAAHAFPMPTQAAHVGWAHADADHGNDKLWKAGRTARVVGNVRNQRDATASGVYTPPTHAISTDIPPWKSGRAARVVTKIRTTIADRALISPYDSARQANAASAQSCTLPITAGGFTVNG